MELNERKLRILKSIIDEYIDHGEPVGSKHLMQYGNFALSSATIRNEMSDLEDMGYLDKPHASAGRIPSNSAYRLYVDELMSEYKESEQQLDLLCELTRFKTDEMDKIITKARKIISKVTNYATLTVETKDEDCIISRFDTLYIDMQGMLLVMIMPDGTVNTKHVNTGVQINALDVAKIRDALNMTLAGKSLDLVALPDIISLEEQFGHLRMLVNPLLRTIYEAAVGNNGKSIEVDGITNLLEYPEFRNVEKVKDLLGLLEPDKDVIRELIPRGYSHAENGLKVYIGDETTNSQLSDASIVFCSMPVGKKNTIFGILGPKRMDYKKAADALTGLANTLKSMNERKDSKGKLLSGQDEKNEPNLDIFESN